MEYIRNITINKMSDSEISNFLSAALYGNYSLIARYNDLTKQAQSVKDNNGCFEDILATNLISGGQIVIEDVEEGDSYIININDFYRGVNKALSDYPRLIDTFLTGYCDLEEADMILQTIIFGEVIYG